ncbi:acid protease [Obba rivulosa]|uniref:Acid protease n=1 Tax=Obba rivulosa TaxID=1052685 RepID=A0A8E2B028_9APHY|nr:acid protease [Obba rivulosa]
MWFLLPAALLALLFDVHALTFPVQVRPSQRSGSLHVRANGNNSLLPIHNTLNSEYITNITLGGRVIPVLLDTGSSDLWVTGNVSGSTDLGISTSLSYAVGNADGDINTATLQFGNYTVEDQAFVLVTDTSSFSVDIDTQGYDGLIGLGPPTGSVIRKKVDDARGDSVLNRIFSQNTTASNYLTILLNRAGDPMSNFTGQVSVSEVVPGYEAVQQMPKLAVEMTHKLTDEDQHWQTYTDVNGIIGPDGQPIQVDSIVPKAPDGQLVVIFDSGYTLPQVPRAMADAIYGRVQGAEYNEEQGLWTIPCEQLLNISFTFGGQAYPIHPLDVSSSDFNMVDSTGSPVCVGTFQPISSAFSLLGEYDIILGMAFMRNVYTLLDYGSWVEDTSHDQGDPFIQLLSVTDVQKAHQDFVNVRLGGVDTTGSPSQALLPVSQMQHSPETKAEKKAQYEEMILSRWPYIFVGCLAFVLLVIGFIVWRCCIRRKRLRAKKQAAHATFLPGNNPAAYKQLEDGQMEMRRSSYASSMRK